MGTGAIGKIAACLEQRQASLSSGPIGLHVGADNNPADRRADVGRINSIAPRQDPDELAKRGRCDGDKFGTLKC